MTILVATDLSARGDRAIARAARIAHERGARLVIVHVLDVDLPEGIASAMEAAAQERLAGIAASGSGDAPQRIEVHVDRGDVATDLHARASAEDAALIVLGVHRIRPLMDIFRETTLERLVRMADRPVLVVTSEAHAAYGKALAALDFSPASTRAAKLAHTLFPDARLHGFHTVHGPFQGLTGAPGHTADVRFYLGAAETELAAWAHRADLKDLAEATEVVEGALHAALARQIEVHDPDVVVLGAHGRTGRAPFLTGSFANDLMRDPPCDLLIARG